MSTPSRAEVESAFKHYLKVGAFERDWNAWADTFTEDAYYSVSSAFMPGGIMNIFGAEDADMTAAFGELAIATPDDRAAAAQATTDAAVQNALALPIAYADTIVLYNPSLQGVEFTKGSGLPTFVTDWSTK